MESNQEMVEKVMKEEAEMLMSIKEEDEENKMILAPQPLSMVACDQAEEASSSHKRKQVLPDDDKAKVCAKERAEEVKANLDPDSPSFVKSMQASSVTWMHIPAQFCRLHLPKQDATITLVDENREEFLTKFLVGKNGFSGGWKGFCDAHKLIEGDALIFQLVGPTKFQVYIVRAYSLGAIDGVIGLLTLDSHPKHSSQSKIVKTEGTVRKRRRTASLANLQPPTGEKSGSDSEDVTSEVLQGFRFSHDYSEFKDVKKVLEGTRFSQDKSEFKDVKNLDSFSITVNGSILDSEFSESTRIKYFKLCSSQNAFLHENLLEGINAKLAAGAISEIVDIADAIKACRLSNSEDDFAAWDKSLGALEQLGMNVSFLRARLRRLLNITVESEEAADLRRYREAMVERARVEEEMRTVKAKLSELEKTSKRLDTEIEPLKEKARRHEVKLLAEVNSPW